MGQNSKPRREAKAKARRRARRAAAGGTPATRAHPLDFGLASTFDSNRSMAQMFRRECSECRSSDLIWMTPAELAELGDDEQSARVAEILAFMGGASDAWRCEKCGNFGLM